MLHFLRRLVLTAGQARLVTPWLALAVASIAVPWIMYPFAGFGSPSDVLAPAALWKVLWSVLLGGVLAVALWRWGRRLPPIPEGDMIAMAGGVVRGAASCGTALERADGFLRQWPAASLSLFLVAILLAVAMLKDS